MYKWTLVDTIYGLEQTSPTLKHLTLNENLLGNNILWYCYSKNKHRNSIKVVVIEADLHYTPRTFLGLW